jgi:lycopene beta-cyclase
MSTDADLLILGGGLAGLSIAARLARRGVGGRVIVIEQRACYEDDRSWAFWTPVGSRWACSAAATWQQWRFGVRAGGTVVAAAPQWRYVFIRSLTVYDAARSDIAANQRVTLALGVQAGAVQRQAGGLMVETSAGRLHARHVIDARPPDPQRVARSQLLQSFYGREITIAEPTDASVADVMYDMRCDPQGFVFAYVLPLSPRHALVEVTRFATKFHDRLALAQELDTLLAKRGWSDASVVREEHAVLPMGLPPSSRHEAMPGMVRAGTAAGALRAASGYGFLRIQSWAEHCVDAIARGQPPLGHPPEPRLRRWMDEVFLRTLATHPELMPEFFLRLAARVPPAALVRFLSDAAHPGDVLRVMAALPPGPFLRAILDRHSAWGRRP